ncbi:MAG: MBL fold metallo-hydrolase [Opitutaceae bacterium]|jgi:glyoxylase-like metal-dependent hydrolase (beta-lactamase superfamily II)|nr:MBL fold metallo-hydrolase [Opitutaceae bacterium]
MARIPLEDNYDDVINKAQRGLGIPDEELARRAEVSAEELAALKSGVFHESVARRVARHLKLHPDALVRLAKKTWHPAQPVFPTGFAAFNTACEDMTVNSYLVWDARSRRAAAFDTGADCGEMLEWLRAERLALHYIFLTHTHEDHVAGLPRLAGETGAGVWASGREPSGFPGARTFGENTHFHLGALTIKTLSTWGHSPGGTSYYITGLSHPLAIVGDSLFSCSMGGSRDDYAAALDNNFKKILSLPNHTVLACGHGPITTVAQEKKNNPFFAR